jgi:hypothetical protein
MKPAFPLTYTKGKVRDSQGGPVPGYLAAESRFYKGLLSRH